MSSLHIDRERLDSDLVYRVEYLTSFIGFSEKDKQLIRDSSSAVSPLIPEIVDRFYEKIFSYDVVKTTLLKSSSNFDGEVPENIESFNLDSALVKYRKMMFTKYFTRLLTAEWDTAHIKYLDWVARSHAATSEDGEGMGIDYVFLNAMLGYLSGVFTDSLSKIKEWNNETRVNTILAFNKFFYIQADLFSRYHVTDKESETLESKVEAKKQEITEIKSSFIESNRGTLFASFAVGIALGSIFAFNLTK